MLFIKISDVSLSFGEYYIPFGEYPISLDEILAAPVEEWEADPRYSKSLWVSYDWDSYPTTLLHCSL